jgi:hypothetical protein
MSGYELHLCGSGQRIVAGACELGNEALGSTKIRKCLRLPEELLASQEGLYSMQLFVYTQLSHSACKI